MSELAAMLTVVAVVSGALQVYGSNGAREGYPLEYLYGMARGSWTAAGADELQRTRLWQFPSRTASCR